MSKRTRKSEATATRDAANGEGTAPPVHPCEAWHRAAAEDLAREMSAVIPPEVADAIRALAAPPVLPVGPGDDDIRRACVAHLAARKRLRVVAVALNHYGGPVPRPEETDLSPMEVEKSSPYFVAHGEALDAHYDSCAALLAFMSARGCRGFRMGDTLFLDGREEMVNANFYPGDPCNDAMLVVELAEGAR